MRGIPFSTTATKTLALVVFFACSLAFAQTPTTTSSPAPTVNTPDKRLTVAPLTQKKWAELSASQKANLKPLESDWHNIGPKRQAKWLEIAAQYPKLSASQQEAMQNRMKEWAQMTPAQRADARLNFAQAQQATKSLTPEEKRARWEAYQALSPEEKQKLAQSKPPLPNSASLASKPVPARKLAAVPASPASSAAGSQPSHTKRIDVRPSVVNRQTLLPQSAPPASAPAQR
jgi:uncharacterized membrane protein